MDMKLLRHGHTVQKQDLKVTDYDGKTTSYEYHNKDLVKQINNNGTELSFEYDSKHRLIKNTDAKGNTASFGFTGALVTSITSADGNTTGLETTYTYDNNSNVTSVSDNMDRVIEFAYDAMDNNTQITMPDESTVKYEYDALRRVVKTTDGEGNSVSYI